MRCCICWILILLFFLARPLPVLALSCRSLSGQLVCIQSLQRSAQKYWEYRVQFKIGEVSVPLEIYDCRSQRQRTLTSQWRDFSHPEIAAFACILFHD
jgi:hypothetical protein